ncbi:portal protein, partial [Helicobacter pylori]|uniref:portal protein n=1 Tax=Helicobacter pylori TaxID=210 RepID=UPI0036F41265
ILDRGQTPIVENMFKMIVNKILGYKIESISEIRLSPKQEEDRALSDLLNSLLQVFIQQENYDRAMIERDKNLLIGGLGVIQLWVTEDKDKNVEIDIKALNPESFVIDYFSTDKNALDARRFHKMLEITEQEALLLFDESVIINYSNINHERIASVIESWYKEYNKETKSYEWNRYLWNRNAGIYKSEKKPFKNGAHPFIISKLYTDESNNYYGLFRDIKPMQDFINYAENRMGNMMGSFKAMFEEDAVVDVAEFVETMSLDNAIAKVRPNALKDHKIQFMNNQADLSALSAKAEQKRQLLRLLAGLNDESLGIAVNRQSGVAIAQRKESGLMGLQTFLKATDDMDRLVFKLAISFICEYFTKEQVFKIVDRKLGDRYFKINSSDDNKIRPLKFDLILKSQLKTESRDEKWNNWNELLKILAPIRPDLVPSLVPLMLNDMDSPITNDVLEAIQNANALQQQNAKANAPYNEQIQALQIQKLQAEIAELQAKASKYEQQGALSQTTNESEKINQAVAISEMQQENANNNVNNAKNKPSKKLKTSDKTTWRKYPSAQNLDY